MWKALWTGSIFFTNLVCHVIYSMERLCDAYNMAPPKCNIAFTQLYVAKKNFLKVGVAPVGLHPMIGGVKTCNWDGATPTFSKFCSMHNCTHVSECDIVLGLYRVSTCNPWARQAYMSYPCYSYYIQWNLPSSGHLACSLLIIMKLWSDETQGESLKVTVYLYNIHHLVARW